MPLTGKRPAVTVDRRMITTTLQPTENSQCVSVEAGRDVVSRHIRSAFSQPQQTNKSVIQQCRLHAAPSRGSFTRLFAKQFVRRQKKKKEAEQLKRASLFPPDGDYNVFLNRVQKTDSEAAAPDTLRQLNQQITPCSVYPS